MIQLPLPTIISVAFEKIMQSSQTFIASLASCLPLVSQFLIKLPSHMPLLHHYLDYRVCNDLMSKCHDLYLFPGTIS